VIERIESAKQTREQFAFVMKEEPERFRSGFRRASQAS
jgi:hypothetical protein